MPCEERAPRAAITLLLRKPPIIHSCPVNPKNPHITRTNLCAIFHRPLSCTRGDDVFPLSPTPLATGILPRSCDGDKSVLQNIKSIWGFTSCFFPLVDLCGVLRDFDSGRGVLLGWGCSGKIRAPPWPDPGSWLLIAMDYRTGGGFSPCGRFAAVLLSFCKKSPLRYGLLSVVDRSLSLSSTHISQVFYYLLIPYLWFQIANWWISLLSVLVSSAKNKGTKHPGLGFAELLLKTSRKGKKPIGVGSADFLSNTSRKGPKSLYEEKIQEGSLDLDDGERKARKLKAEKKTKILTITVKLLVPLMASSTVLLSSARIAASLL